MVILLAFASMEFSTNSAIALRGLLCESAMIRMAFQSSPILSFPPSLFFVFPFVVVGIGTAVFAEIQCISVPFSGQPIGDR